MGSRDGKDVVGCWDSRRLVIAGFVHGMAVDTGAFSIEVGGLVLDPCGSEDSYMLLMQQCRCGAFDLYSFLSPLLVK